MATTRWDRMPAHWKERRRELGDQGEEMGEERQVGEEGRAHRPPPAGLPDPVPGVS